MSLANFQRAFARLVAEPGFAASVRGGAAVPGLSARERERLVAAARDPGLGAATTVHFGWRLSKLLALLPLTRAALGEALGDLAREFWATRPPRTLYFQGEAIEFCRFVAGSEEVPAAARELAEFEAAAIALEMGAEGGGSDRVEVEFEHDPQELIEAAASDELDLDSVPVRPARVIGRRGDDGSVRWSFVPAAEAAPPATR
jgi:hypothetical protein